MRVLIIANGEPPSAALLDELLPGAEAVVAADGGADVALALGVVPAAVVGDLDSVSPEARSRIPAERFRHSDDPNTTDLEKAIDFALQLGASEVDVVGAGGARADHALANLSVLAVYRGQARLRIVDDLFEVSLVDGRANIEAPPGTVVSLVAIGRCLGVTTRNLRWDLTDYDLDFSPYGIHNEVVASPAEVTVRDGTLLLFKGRWVEKHR